MQLAIVEQTCIDTLSVLVLERLASEAANDASASRVTNATKFRLTAALHGFSGSLHRIASPTWTCLGSECGSKCGSKCVGLSTTHSQA